MKGTKHKDGTMSVRMTREQWRVIKTFILNHGQWTAAANCYKDRAAFNNALSRFTDQLTELDVYTLSKDY